jgi:hypothetical protein
MRTAERDTGGGVLGFAIVILTVVFSAIGLPIPSPAYFLLIAVGTWLAIREAGVSGFGLGALVLGAVVVAISLATRVIAWSPDAPDLEEPIPVPSGYGFELDPDSTNVEHLYDSGPIPPQRAEFAAVEVADHYVNALAPAWTVVDRDERPEVSSVTLRQGDSSRGISIFVGVVTPLGQPTALDLRIRALVCSEDLPGVAPGEVTCMTAPIRHIVSYPDGEPVVPSPPPPSPGPLREPVPVPPGYGFRLGNSSALVHEYQSTDHISFREGARARRAVLRYYRRVLDDWTVVERDTVNLLMKAPDSTDGLAIEVTEYGGTVVVLEIRAITCLEDGWCSWGP